MRRQGRLRSHPEGMAGRTSSVPATPGVKPSRDGACQKPKFSEDGLRKRFLGRPSATPIPSAIILLGTVLEVIFHPDGH